MRINNRYTGHVLPENANDAKVAKSGGNIAGRRLIFDGFPPVIYSLRTFSTCPHYIGKKKRKGNRKTWVSGSAVDCFHRGLFVIYQRPFFPPFFPLLLFFLALQ
jgi:hypothetical protein